MTDKQDVTFTVNGDERMIRVEPRRSLADALREDCGLTGTQTNCTRCSRRSGSITDCNAASARRDF